MAFFSLNNIQQWEHHCFVQQRCAYIKKALLSLSDQKIIWHLEMPMSGLKKYEKIHAKNAIFQLGRRNNVLYSMVTIPKTYICEYYYQNFPHKNKESLKENMQKLVWSSHFKMILTNIFIFESITHVHNEIGSYLPPVSSFQLDTLLSQLHVCFSFFDNPLSSVSASHMCMGVGPSSGAWGTSLWPHL